MIDNKTIRVYNYRMAFCENSYYNNQLRSFYDFSPGGFQDDLRRFSSLRGRLLCFKELIKKGVFLPLFLVVRGLATCLRASGVFVGVLLVAVSLAGSEKVRRFFLRRIAFLARDLADWILVPFILVRGFFSLAAGCIHPAAYFN